MLYSKLFTKTSRDFPADETSKNAQLLIKAGFIHKTMAGVYAYLPLGLRVLEKIKQITREEMNSVGGQELIMSSLQKRETWEITNRWDDKIVDVWFKSKLKNNTEVGFGWSHEEAIIEMMKNHITSYKDLPANVYQFQTKMRNELRAKSGIMRGREFVMKDMYSCSINEEQHEKFYQETILAYHRIFSRVGVGEITYLTFASGGAFTEFSHEFQTICDAGEDYIYIDKAQKVAINEEVLTDKVLDMLNVKRENLEKIKTLETGNIFNFGLIKSEQTDFKFTNKEGKEQLVWFGSYGIGMTRLMGVIAEIYSDEKGLKWPQSVAPFEIHLVSGVEKDEEINQKIQDICKQLYTKEIDLTTEIEGLNTDYEILWDERNTGLGSKLGDSELIGCPWQILVTKRSLENGGIEIKNRATGETKVVGL